MHHPLVPHMSLPNTSARPRRVIILRFMGAAESQHPGTFRHWQRGTAVSRQYYVL